MIQTKTVTSKRVELLIKRKPDGSMEDKTLCGRLWDHPVVTAKNICEECKKVAARNGYDW